jgi:phosphohistidine phosphatase
MLRLTLIRHAKAEPTHAGQEDWDRALDSQGQREAVEMGRRLQQRALHAPLLVSSSAVRALSTANLLARELGLQSTAVMADDRLYLISATALLDWIHERASAADLSTEHLMLVAHNPGLSEFAAHIAVHPTVTSLPTCGVLTLQVDIERWEDLSWRSGVDAVLEFPQHRL